MKLAFYCGPREGVWKLVSWIVRTWTRGPFCHVEMILSDGRTANSSISRDGIHFESGKHYDPAHWVIVPVEGDEDAARLWFALHLGEKFDVWGMLGFLFRPHRGDNDRWFCSEACAAALGFSDPWRFDPNTLFAVINRGKP